MHNGGGDEVQQESFLGGESAMLAFAEKEATEFGMFHPPDVVDQATALCSSSPSTMGRLGVSGACAV